MPSTARLRALLAKLGLGAAVACAGCTGLGTQSFGCSDDSSCESGRVCRDGDCVVECLEDRDCPEGEPLCRFQRCVAPEAPASLPPFPLDAGATPG